MSGAGIEHEPGAEQLQLSLLIARKHLGCVGTVFELVLWFVSIRGEGMATDRLLASGVACVILASSMNNLLLDSNSIHASINRFSFVQLQADRCALAVDHGPHGSLIDGSWIMAHGSWLIMDHCLPLFMCHGSDAWFMASWLIAHGHGPWPGPWRMAHG